MQRRPGRVSLEHAFCISSADPQKFLCKAQAYNEYCAKRKADKNHKKLNVYYLQVVLIDQDNCCDFFWSSIKEGI